MCPPTFLAGTLFEPTTVIAHGEAAVTPLTPWFSLTSLASLKAQNVLTDDVSAVRINQRVRLDEFEPADGDIALRVLRLVEA